MFASAIRATPELLLRPEPVIELRAVGPAACFVDLVREARDFKIADLVSGLAVLARAALRVRLALRSGSSRFSLVRVAFVSSFSSCGDVVTESQTLMSASMSFDDVFVASAIGQIKPCRIGLSPGSAISCGLISARAQRNRSRWAWCMFRLQSPGRDGTIAPGNGRGRTILAVPHIRDDEICRQPRTKRQKCRMPRS